jgi:hypothetical protein
MVTIRLLVIGALALSAKPTPIETKIREMSSPEISRETPYLAPYRERAVCKDWMVGAPGLKLVPAD